jgi:hypothetical protein
MSDFLALLKLIPVLLGLIKSIRAEIQRQQTNATIAQHVAVIKDAYASKDASKLDALFNKPS